MTMGDQRCDPSLNGGRLSHHRNGIARNFCSERPRGSAFPVVVPPSASRSRALSAYRLSRCNPPTFFLSPPQPANAGKYPHLDFNVSL
jgi:hypothetical protein